MLCYLTSLCINVYVTLLLEMLLEIKITEVESRLHFIDIYNNYCIEKHTKIPKLRFLI